jgi:hypothetical protein
MEDGLMMLAATGEKVPLSNCNDGGSRVPHTFSLLFPLQGDLVKVRQSYAEITAMQRRLMKQKEQADALAGDWYNRAQLALKAGNEGKRSPSWPLSRH